MDKESLTNKAKDYLGEKPLTLQQIKMIRTVLNNRAAKWVVERQSGKLSREDRDKLLEFLRQEEVRLLEERNNK